MANYNSKWLWNCCNEDHQNTYKSILMKHRHWNNVIWNTILWLNKEWCKYYGMEKSIVEVHWYIMGWTLNANWNWFLSQILIQVKICLSMDYLWFDSRAMLGCETISYRLILVLVIKELTRLVWPEAIAASQQYLLGNGKH